MNKRTAFCILAIILTFALVSTLSFFAISNSRNETQNNIQPQPSPTPSPTQTPIPKPTPQPSDNDLYWLHANAVLQENNVTVYNVTSDTINKFPAQLTEIRLNIDTLAKLFTNKTLFFYLGGRMFGEGLLRNYWCWFWVEGTTIYYTKYQYYFGW